MELQNSNEDVKYNIWTGYYSHKVSVFCLTKDLLLTQSDKWNGKMRVKGENSILKY